MSARAKWAVAAAATLVLGGSVAATACTWELPLFGGGGGGGEPKTANVWVDDDGGTCARSATPAEYSDSAACSTFASAYSAAAGGDTVRIKAATYDGEQSVGGSKTPDVTFVGEDGTVVDTTRDTSLHGLTLNGNVVVSNVDVGGDMPFVYVGGNGSTWRDSTLLESSDDDCCARGIAGVTTPVPILIYDDSGFVENAELINLVIEPQHICTPGEGKCGGGDVYHLESIRIDQNVDGVLIDRVTFEDGGEDNTALVFVTTPSADTYWPSDITIQNSAFGSHVGSYNLDFGGGGRTCTITLAYNTFTKEGLNTCGPESGVEWIGNVGPKSPAACSGPGQTWTRNVWQWSADTRCAGSGDTWVEGPNFSLSAMGLDSSYRPNAGSPVLGAGETSYCFGALGGIDRDGSPRTGTCDAGAFERD